MLKPPKQVSRRQELREDKVITAYARTMTMAEKYRGALIAAGIGIVVIIFGVLGYTYYMVNQGEVANDALGEILPVYESGSFQEALDGTADAPGLLEIADEYGSTGGGNLARFYAASALFELGRYEEAGAYFEDYDGGEDILGASAVAGQAAIAEQAGDFADAARLYQRAARSYESAATAPGYYLDAARNFEQAGDFDAARAAYEEIVEEYPDAPQAANVPAYTARLAAMAQAGE
ncbi:MAG: tetratricopeptide repeat protein [Rhodothermales bacterium]